MVGRNWETPVHGDLAEESELMSPDVFLSTAYSLSPLWRWSVERSSILPTRLVVDTPCVLWHSLYRPADLTMW